MTIMKPPDSGVKVRMYDTGFGDCFLLAFRAEDGSARYLLIDFGVHHQFPGRQERMKLIADDIAEATDNNLHVVAITHEHTDHLYGFKYGRDEFDEIKIDELWLAWTEDTRNATANQLKERYGMRINTLTAAAKQLSLSNEPEQQRIVEMIQSLPDFELSADLLSATGGKAKQMEYLRDKTIKKLEESEDYLHPEKEPITLEDVKGVKIYVLGPPENIEWIKKMKSKSELYPELREMNEEAAFTAAILTAAGETDEDDELFWRSRPFEENYKIKENDARTHPEYGNFYAKFYGFSDDEEHGPEWRRIDLDWLATAEQLALDIDSKTNNTSLVLAIELTRTQPLKVLLFAADAQLGNWLSWHELKWPGEGPDGGTVSAEDLLKRTVLYKMGHHGSHNATLSKKGLELMESSELVAMIPVDEKWANEEKGWRHPAEKLLKRLTEKARGRIIRTDKIPEGDEPPQKPDEATVGEWDAFIKQLGWDKSDEKLWIEYTVLE
jgi:hypothetical protein